MTKRGDRSKGDPRELGNLVESVVEGYYVYRLIGLPRSAYPTWTPTFPPTYQEQDLFLELGTQRDASFIRRQQDPSGATPFILVDDTRGSSLDWTVRRTPRLQRLADSLAAARTRDI